MLSQGLPPIHAIQVSEAKGIFQRLSNVYQNPRRFCSLIGNFSFAHNLHKNVTKMYMTKYEQPENESPSRVRSLSQVLNLETKIPAKAWQCLFLSLLNEGNRNWGQEPACELWKSLTLLPVVAVLTADG